MEATMAAIRVTLYGLLAASSIVCGFGADLVLSGVVVL
jgi:hypothetical protein